MRIMGSLFSLSNVSVVRDGKRILGPLDLSVDEGESIAVIGRNGSGKTTLSMLLKKEISPYYDELVSGTRDGSLAVSIFGGGTCNSEFEFLTGYSMSSLLPGSSVYTFYVNHETEALPYLFAQEGYRTVALHSFDGDWWERRAKYPLLGFQEFYTRDDFDQENCEYVRRYISDKETFHKITDISSMEPAVLIYCSLGGLWILVITYHYMRTTGKDLSILGK